MAHKATVKLNERQLELTPARQRELEHVSAEVRREDLHDAQVHVQRLQPRPGEGGQQEVVQEDGGADAQRRERVARQPAVQQEDQVEEEEGGAQLDEDLGRDVPQELPAPSGMVVRWVVAVLRPQALHEEVRLTHSKERYVSSVTERNIAEIPQPM